MIGLIFFERQNELQNKLIEKNLSIHSGKLSFKFSLDKEKEWEI
jgi:hypothetical protein